jgi:hypothetical protein
LEHRPLAPAAALEVGPIYGEHGARDALEQRLGNRTINRRAFGVEKLVSEQPIHRFDVMLDLSAAGSVSAQLRQCCLASKD